MNHHQSPFLLLHETLMEESVNFVKVSTSSDEDDVIYQSQPPKRRRTVAVVVTLTLLAVIIGAILTAGVVNVNHNQTNPPESNSVKSLNSIKAVCAVTQNPDSCFTDITAIDSGNFIDPEIIFNLTLQLAVTELTNISSLPKTLISKSYDLRTGSALRDCATLFEDASSQLSKSVDLMRVTEKVLLTEDKVADIKTWISAAMTDQDTCVEGLEEMGSTAVDEVKLKMKRSSELMSNSLAILDNMNAILNKFGLHLH